jgi:ABC-type sugar transport system ATPase subunit
LPQSALGSPPGDRAKAVAATARPVTVGIRPEHVTVVPAGSGAATAVVELIEPVGPVTYVDLTLGTRSLRASVGGSQRYRMGEEVGLDFQTDAIHYFDGDSGVRAST